MFIQLCHQMCIIYKPPGSLGFLLDVIVMDFIYLFSFSVTGEADQINVVSCYECDANYMLLSPFLQ